MSESRKLIPTVALRGMTIMPDTIIHFDLSRQKSILAVEQAMMQNQTIFLVAQKDMDVKEPGFSDVYHMGTIANIRQVIKLPNNIVRVLVEGIARAELFAFEDIEEYLLADVVIVDASAVDISDAEAEAMTREIMELFLQYTTYYPKVGKAVGRQLAEVHDLGKLLDQIVSNIPLSFTNRQSVLEKDELKARFHVVKEILTQEVTVAKIRGELQSQVKGRVDKNQKEYILREQLKYIREELGEDNFASDADRFEEETEGLNAPDEVKEKIKKEIKRFRNIASRSAEATVARAYIETLLEMPWDKASEDNKDLKNAKKILDEDHYGLEKVKERILRRE